MRDYGIFSPIWARRRRQFGGPRTPRARIFAFTLLLGFLFPVSGKTAPSEAIPDAQDQRPRIGVVLSGGGARGVAHLGVLRVLEQNRIPIDMIAGTSMGAVIGGLYAAGLSVDEIERALKRVDWADIFSDTPERSNLSFRRKRDDDDFLVKAAPGWRDGSLKFPTGLILGHKFAKLVTGLTLNVATINDFDDLPIRFRAVATDIASGQAVVLRNGDLATAMRATMSVPGVFAPVEVDGKLLVDGGVANNLPVDVAREMGADILIVVDVSAPLYKKSEINSVLAVTEQFTSILTRSNADRNLASLKPADVVIVPDLGDIGSASFSRSSEAIPLGEAAAQQHAAQLRRLALSEPDFADYLQMHLERRQKRLVISRIDIRNRSRLSSLVIANYFIQLQGQPVDAEAIDRAIDDVFGLGYFQRVSYRLRSEDQGVVLDVEVEEKTWGPNYLRFGANLEDNLSGDTHYNLGVSYLKTMINPLGGEWRSVLHLGENPRIFTEFFQPLDYERRYFVAPNIYIEENNVNEVDSEGQTVASYRVRNSRFNLEFGRELGVWGEMRIGWRRGSGFRETRFGTASVSDGHFNSGDILGQVTVDKLDNWNFPRSGLYGEFQYRLSRRDYGAEENFDQAYASVFQAISFRRYTLLLSGLYGTTLNADAPVQDLFRLGGFLKLSGYSEGELSGQNVALARAIFYRRVGDLTFLPAYVGFSVESGDTWDRQAAVDIGEWVSSGSIFVGLDTPLGPLFLAYGRADQHRDSVYLVLGRNFHPQRLKPQT